MCSGGWEGGRSTRGAKVGAESCPPSANMLICVDRLPFSRHGAHARHGVSRSVCVAGAGGSTKSGVAAAGLGSNAPTTPWSFSQDRRRTFCQQHHDMYLTLSSSTGGQHQLQRQPMTPRDITELSIVAASENAQTHGGAHPPAKLVLSRRCATYQGGQEGVTGAFLQAIGETNIENRPDGAQ